MSTYETTACELIRALRGNRSQAWLSKRMGYTSNVLFRWERGQREPTLGQTLALAQAVGIDVRRALVRFDACLDPLLPRVLEEMEVGGLLVRASWSQSAAELARQARMTPSALERILRGESAVRLACFLQLTEISTGRALEWISSFVDPARLPSTSQRWARLEAARDAARLAPVTEGMLAILETEAYRALAAHPRGYFASCLGIDEETEDQALALLVQRGWVVRQGGRYEVTQERHVDTRVLPPDTRALLREFWVRHAARRLEERGPAALASYVVFSASQARLARVLEVMEQAYTEVRAILREPESEDAVTRAVTLTTMACALDGRGLRDSTPGVGL
ncbi:MAG: helix-turn-helix domain-containing protein [Deltaproteobacteria bacterium]